MKWPVLVLVLSISLSISCDVDNPFGTEDPVPRDTIPSGTDTSTVHACVLEKIQYLETRGNDADTTAILQFFYDGQIVYLYYAECCDRYDELHDTLCKPICSPTGGFGGNGNGTCPDFLDRAIFIKYVWRKY